MLEEKIKSRYQGEEGKQYHNLKRRIPPAAFPWVARIRAAKIAPYLRPDDVVFEYGAGYGWNLAALNCRRRIGHDIGDFVAPALEEQGIEFIPDPRAIPDQSIDVMIFHHVLEHALHPPALLLEGKRMLRKGGTLLLFVPYEKERRYRQFHPQEPNHHLYSWNVQTLGQLTVACGFQFKEGNLAMFSYDRFSSVWANRLGLGEKGYHLIRRLSHLLYPCLEVRIVAENSET